MIGNPAGVVTTKLIGFMISLVRKRINPPERGKPGKVPICRVEGAPVFYGQRSKMGIRDKIPHGTGLPDLSLENSPVVLGRTDNTDAGLVDPTLHTLNCFLWCERAVMQSRVGGDPQEGLQNRPAQMHRLAAAQNAIPPSSRCLMVRGKAVFRIEQQVCIRKNHP